MMHSWVPVIFLIIVIFVFKVVEAVLACKMTNARGEIKYPIKVDYINSVALCKLFSLLGERICDLVWFNIVISCKYAAFFFCYVIVRTYLF